MGADQLKSERASAKWPHRVAMLMVCATFPLIWVGGLVTTYDAGMAVPDWPSTYGYNLFLYPVSTWLGGPWDLFIEHGHRLLASLVGLIAIVFVATTWRVDDRRWMKWYATACLGLVVLQGVVGGLRVVFDETLLARVHGCLGPLFFAFGVAAAAFTSTWWRKGDSNAGERTAAGRKFVSMAWCTTVLVYVQLVLGAHLRHPAATWSPRLFQVFVIAHLAIAGILVIYIAALTWKRRSLRTTPVSVRIPVAGLCVCTAIQLLLGAGAWRVKYYWPHWLPQPSFLEGYTVAAESMTQTITVTAHVAMGSLILAISTLIAVRSTRFVHSAPRSVAGTLSSGMVLEAVL